MNKELASHLNRYWAWGLSIVPVPYKQKGCLLPNWDKYRSERASKDVVKGWFSSSDYFYPNAEILPSNIGLVTGYNNFCVLDFDRPGALWESLGGLDNLRNLTPIISSSEGRYHVYLKVAGEPPRDFRFDEGEVKGIGMVCAPPSIHPSGRGYRFVNPEVRDILEVATLAELGIIPTNGAANKIATAVPAKIEAGARDDTLTSIAGSLQRRAIAPATIKEVLLVINEKQVEPPLSERDLDKIVNSVGKYTPAAQRQSTQSVRYR